MFCDLEAKFLWSVKTIVPTIANKRIKPERIKRLKYSVNSTRPKKVAFCPV
jgi:hypothetical protein